jgi:uncharacterized membrane protein
MENIMYNKMRLYDNDPLDMFILVVLGIIILTMSLFTYFTGITTTCSTMSEKAVTACATSGAALISIAFTYMLCANKFLCRGQYDYIFPLIIIAICVLCITVLSIALKEEDTNSVCTGKDREKSKSLYDKLVMMLVVVVVIGFITFSNMLYRAGLFSSLPGTK